MRNTLVTIAMLLLVVAFPSGRATAHDPHTHLANALSSAKSPAGGLCCDGKDYVIPNDWHRTESGAYRIRIGDVWLDVPKDAEVTNMRNPDMEAKAWLISGEGETWVRCFMPGSEV